MTKRSAIIHRYDNLGDILTVERNGAATIPASSNLLPGTVHRNLGHASFATTIKLYGGLTTEALESPWGRWGNAFEPKPDKSRTNESA